MQAAHIRLTITLVIALIGHLVLLYPTPKLIPIPLKDITYSVEVELTQEKASENAQAVSDIKNKDQVESQASSASEGQTSEKKPTSDTLKTATKPTPSSKDSKQQQNVSASQTPITQQETASSHKIDTTETEANQSGLPTPLVQTTDANKIQKTDEPIVKAIEAVKQTQPKQDKILNKTKSKQEESPLETVTQRSEEVIQKQETLLDTASSSKAPVQTTEEIETIKQDESIQSEASSKNTVKSEALPELELSATEQYEAQVYAWILTGPNSRVFEGYGKLKRPVTIQATWWKNGTVIFATIKQSSGNPTADAAAKRTVLSANPFPRIPDHLNKKEYTLDITLKYFEK